MIKHIVMWRIEENLEGKSKLENAKFVKDSMEALKNEIKEIINIEVGINIVEAEQAYDLVLNSEFANLEDLNIYQKHPSHVKVVDLVKPLLNSRVVIDYEVK